MSGAVIVLAGNWLYLHVLLLQLWPISMSSTHQETLGHTAAGSRGTWGGSLKQEAAEGSEVCRLGDCQRASRQNRMGRCEERWHEGGRAEQTVCWLGSPWPIHLQPPAGRETAGAGGGGREPVSSHLIAFCGGWDKVRALPLRSPLVHMQPQLDWWQRRCPHVPDSWDKQHIRLKSLSNPAAQINFHVVKKKVTFWLFFFGPQPGWDSV